MLELRSLAPQNHGDERTPRQRYLAGNFMPVWSATAPGKIQDGCWTYGDSDQIQIAAIVLRVLDMDLAVYDAWLYGNQHWSGYSLTRQRLINAREKLTFCYRDFGGADGRTAEGVVEFFWELRRQFHNLKNIPAEIRVSSDTFANANRDKGGRQPNPDRDSQIKREYSRLVAGGKKYGAIKRLAEHHNLSTATIRRAALGT